MLGTIIIRDLDVRCVVGLLPHERETEQRLSLDLDLELDFGPAARSESLGSTVDYATVAREVAAQIRRRRYRLLETLAVETCHALLAAHAVLTRVRIEVRKPDAVAEAACVGCVFEARRGGPL